MSIKRAVWALSVAAALLWVVAMIWLAVVTAKSEQSPVPDFVAILAGTLAIVAAVIGSARWVVERQFAAVRVIRPAWLPAPGPRIAYAGAPPPPSEYERPTVEVRPAAVGDGEAAKIFLLGRESRDRELARRERDQGDGA